MSQNAANHENHIPYQLTGWRLHNDGSSLTLDIYYAETPVQVQNGEHRTLHTVVRPQQALQLAESLKKVVNPMLPPP